MRYRILSSKHPNNDTFISSKIYINIISSYRPALILKKKIFVHAFPIKKIP